MILGCLDSSKNHEAPGLRGGWSVHLSAGVLTATLPVSARRPLNGLRISEALGADVEDLDFERGHRTLKIVRKGGKHATIPLAPRASRALDLYIGERTTGPIFLAAKGRRTDRYAATAR